MGAEARGAGFAAFTVFTVVTAPLAGCSTFAGESVADAEDDSATSTATTGSGGGGGGGLPTNDPDAYLPVLDAAELCALAGECPLFGASIVASIGVPIVGVDAVDQRIELSYSACLGWLATPVAPGRIGFEAQQELLYGVIPSGCAGGIELLPLEAFANTDARCEGAPAQYCDGDRLVDCNAGLALACTAPPYSAATTCIETAEGTARCGIAAACDGASPSCDGSFSVDCTDDVLTAFDCASIGLGCSEAIPGACGGESGVALCDVTAFGDEGCSPDGERASLCLGGRVAETDCDAVGLSCVDDGARVWCGDPAAEAAGERCNPYDPDVDVCEGDILHTCIGGDRVDIDCMAFGRQCRKALTVTLADQELILSARCGI